MAILGKLMKNQSSFRSLLQHFIPFHRSNSGVLISTILLLGSTILGSSLTWSADPDASGIVGANNWTPAAAEARQRRAKSDQLRNIKALRGEQAALEAQQRNHERETGYGTIPHAPPDADRLMQEEQLRQLTALQFQAQLQGISFATLEGEMMGGLLDRPLGAPTNMILRTLAQGPVTSGSHVFAFDPGSMAYLGYSPIGAAGEIALPVSPGTEIDIMVFAYPPFAFQVVRAVTAAEAMDVFMENAV